MLTLGPVLTHEIYIFPALYIFCVEPGEERPPEVPRAKAGYVLHLCWFNFGFYVGWFH